ncbi:MAG: ABC transporter permease [Polyangiaceae bacterium]
MLDPVIYWLDNLGNLISLTGKTLFWLIRPPYRISQFINAMDFIGVQSIFIVGLTGTFSGMVLALQTTYALRAFSAEGRVGGIVAVSLTREIAPVFAGIMVTARAGSAMAAELGNMRVTEQIDAITTMGVSPVQYLLSPRLFVSGVARPVRVPSRTALRKVVAFSRPTALRPFAAALSAAPTLASVSIMAA